MSLLDHLNKIFGGLASRWNPKSGRPRTFQAETANPNLDRPIVFEPALRQFTAHSAGEPRFKFPMDETLWYSLRCKVLHFVLTKIHDSPWRQNLVLRGSALMAAWHGERARRPGDLDWVVTPEKWLIEHPQSRQLVEGVLELVQDSTIQEGLSIPANSCAIEEIWLYEKAPGLRVILPWEFEDEKYSGTVQMDFVFGERMPSLPVTTLVKIGDLPPIEMQSASPEQSLAWKLLWLDSDCYAMGKDLYDAALLAEKFSLRADLLVATFLAGGEGEMAAIKGFRRRSVLDWHVEWDDFAREYSQVVGTAEDWKLRLANFLEPLFQELEKYAER